MITLEQAKQLKPGTILHHNINRNADGTCQRWRVNGIPQTWKTQPDRVRVPVKYGLKKCDNITENDLDLVHYEGECQ